MAHSSDVYPRGLSSVDPFLGTMRRRETRCPEVGRASKRGPIFGSFRRRRAVRPAGCAVAGAAQTPRESTAQLTGRVLARASSEFLGFVEVWDGSVALPLRACPSAAARATSPPVLTRTRNEKWVSEGPLGPIDVMFRRGYPTVTPTERLRVVAEHFCTT